VEPIGKVVTAVFLEICSSVRLLTLSFFFPSGTSICFVVP